jgi:hypothetical protein
MKYPATVMEVGNFGHNISRYFVIYTHHLVLLGYDGLVMWLGWGDKECTQNFGGEMSTWNTEKEIRR